MTTCAYVMCDNTLIATDKKRYCSRNCQVAAYRRQHTNRTFVTLTRAEHQAVKDLAAAENTTMDDIIAMFVREGLEA